MGKFMGREEARPHSPYDVLTRVGPGTPAGNLTRQYWIPTLMSSELPEADATLLWIRLLCEELIAFRSTSGVVGLVQNARPHRRASLFFGRNEGDGLRCVYSCPLNFPRIRMTILDRCV